jgi:hypothetical protein
MKNRLYKYIVWSILVCSGFLSSCENEEDLGTAPRLFRPNAEVETASNWIKATWLKIKGATSFTIQLSTDSFATIYRDTTVVTNYFTFEGVDWDMVYQIRVKCNGDGIESKYFVCPNVEVKYPTLLKDIASTDIIDVAVRTRWTNSAITPFDTIKVFNVVNDSIVANIGLTAINLSDSMVEIGGLVPSTNYKVVIYSKGVYCGYKKFSTKAAQIFSIPVDLRGEDDATAATMITTTFLQGLADSSTVILKPGMKYVITNQPAFDKTVTFVTGLGFGALPAEFSMSSNFNLPAGAAVGEVKFMGVNFIGTNPSAGFSGNFGGYYLFNINTSSTIQKITVDNCVVKYLRGVVRVQAGGPKITSLTINNCIIDSIAGYGIANVDNVDAAIENISISNSTVSNVQHFIRSTRSPTVSTKTIIVENCTFYQVPQSANYFLDISGNAIIEGGAIIRNCIFGPGLPNALVPPTTNFAGFRAANIPMLDSNGNFKTSDMTWTVGTEIPSVSDYSGSSADLFTNPSTGNFKIKDNSFAGAATAGDPRWRL